MSTWIWIWNRIYASSLHAAEGPENLSEKLTGCPKGSTKFNIVKENKEKADCIAEIAKVLPSQSDCEQTPSYVETKWGLHHFIFSKN
jgi:hypothetical protein